MPVFMAGGKSRGVDWFLSQVLDHFPVVGSSVSYSTSSQRARVSSVKISSSSLSLSALYYLMRHVDMPDYTIGLKNVLFPVFFQLAFGECHPGCYGIYLLLAFRV